MIKLVSKEEKAGLLKDLPAPPQGKTGWPWNEEVSPGSYKKLKTLPKISIVTPSFNQAEYVEQTIRSVLLQNYPALEYVVIDGGSTDGSAEIIEKYKPWLKYYITEKDRGQTHALNKGLQKCDGDIFNWLNSDDYYNKDCFKVLAENFDKDTYMIAGNYRFFYDGKENKKKEKIIDFKLREMPEETIAFVLINQPSTFFRLDILKSLGKLDERLHFVMDQDIWKKFLFVYGQDKIKIVRKELANFRYHSNSKTYQYKFNTEYVNIFYSIALKAGMEEHIELFKTIYGSDIGKGYDFKIQFTEKHIRLAKKVINHFFFSIARNAFTEKDYKLLNLCLPVIQVKYLNEKQKDYAFRLKIKSKLIKYNLKPVLKLINKSNSRKFSNGGGTIPQN